MANQAVDILLGCEVEIGVFPAVAGVAAGAAGPVALDANAEVVDRILFADRHQLVAAFQQYWFAFPGPVDSLADLVG